jgi:hypothetical protein
VRTSSLEGGVLKEAVKGITGLREDPGVEVRHAQVEGRPTPPLEDWNSSVAERLKWVPDWNDWSLSQLSPGGFTVKKRTKAGCSWVNIPSGTRAGGLVYLGGASKGGLALGMKDFWERYPTKPDIRNAASATGEITFGCTVRLPLPWI